MMNEEAYIYEALRTPRGKGKPAKGDKPGGALSAIGPHDLVAQLADALCARCGPAAAGEVERLILGCVGQVGAQGGHIALVSRLSSSLDDAVSVKTINNYCVSGLSACGEAVLRAQAGEGGLSLAGGVESLSQVPFLADRAGYYADPELAKRLKWAPPIMGAELIASLEGFEKTDLDALTLSSHQRAAAAWEQGRYESGVIPVRSADGAVVLERDELIRPGLDFDALSAMPPAFAEDGARGYDTMMLEAFSTLTEISHVHSIAHCPGMADGAALALIGGRAAGAAAGLSPRARVLSFVEAAGDPVYQFSAGFSAMEQALDAAGAVLDDMDRIEFMEAFAAIPLKFYKDYAPDPEKVNANGGHLAMGHPMGATGAILLTTLLHELERINAERGLVVAHAGGGIGAAMVIERV